MIGHLPNPRAIAFIALAAASGLNLGYTDRQPHYQRGRCKGREYTATDWQARRNRIAKWRARKKAAKLQK